MERPITEEEVAKLLTRFGEHTRGKTAPEFIDTHLGLVATNAMLLKVKESGGQLPDLLQLVAWGAYLAEQGGTHLTLVRN